MSNFVSVIWQSNPFGATIAGGSLLFPVALAVISAKTHSLGHIKINSISKLINGIFETIQKLLMCFRGITISVSFFTNFVCIITSFTSTNIISISCNTCLVFKGFRIRRKRITWFMYVIIPQTACYFFCNSCCSQTNRTLVLQCQSLLRCQFVQH